MASLPNKNNSLGLNIDDDNLQIDADISAVNKNLKLDDAKYLLPIAIGDRVLDDDHLAAVDPLSLDDPLSLALRRNRQLLNPTSSNSNPIAASSQTKTGRMKTALSRSANSIKDMLTESIARSRSKGSLTNLQDHDDESTIKSNGSPLQQTMTAGVPVTDSIKYNFQSVQHSLPRSKSKGSMSNLMEALSFKKKA